LCNKDGMEGGRLLAPNSKIMWQSVAQSPVTAFFGKGQEVSQGHDAGGKVQAMYCPNCQMLLVNVKLKTYGKPPAETKDDGAAPFT
jgi:hypothetical protein